MNNITFFDCEVYANYFLVAFLNGNGQVKTIEKINDSESDFNGLLKVFRNRTFVGFNSTSFDWPMLAAFMAGYTNKELLDLCNSIIISGEFAYNTYKNNNLKKPNVDSIDLIEVAAGKYSLKEYGAQLHAKSLIELPYKPGSTLTIEQCQNVKDYCINDLQLTKLLYDELLPEIELRVDMGKLYNFDLRSKSRAQIAEAVIRDGLIKTGIRIAPSENKVPKSVTYEAPTYVTLTNQVTQSFFNDVTSNAITLTAPTIKVSGNLAVTGNITSTGNMTATGNVHSNATGHTL